MSQPQGLKPASISPLNAALKRRSSTVLQRYSTVIQAFI